MTFLCPLSEKLPSASSIWTVLFVYLPLFQSVIPSPMLLVKYNIYVPPSSCCTCQSVGRSVCRSVGMSVSLNLGQLITQERFAQEPSNLVGR